MEFRSILQQHPMYLLICEDSQCHAGLLVPKTRGTEAYHARLRQIIAACQKYPLSKIGFAWSALKLEQLAVEAPDLFADFATLVKRGQVALHSVTYSQPLLQMFSAESNYRQFEWGARVLRDLFGEVLMRVSMHSDPSLNEQTPQLLKAFGVHSALVPRSSVTMTRVESGDSPGQERTDPFFADEKKANNDEFASWRGLDGSRLGLYLHEVETLASADWEEFQNFTQHIHSKPVIVEIPGLLDLKDDGALADFDFALLEDLLESSEKVSPPPIDVNLHVNRGLIAGIRAEELSRWNWKAESSALQAEGLSCLAFTLLGREIPALDAVWQKILMAQQPDAYRFCAAELRANCISQLQEANAQAEELSEDAAQAISLQINTAEKAGQTLVVFNSTPHLLQSIVDTVVDGSDVEVFDRSGKFIPCEANAIAGGKTHLRFCASLKGMGYTTLTVKPANPRAPRRHLASPSSSRGLPFENEFYRVSLLADGTFASLKIQPSGEELLRYGNRLSASDSNVPNFASQARDGRASSDRHELLWQPSEAPVILSSGLGVTFKLAGRLGNQTEAIFTANFYHALARIDLDWTFTFHEASIGSYSDDALKLRMQWLLGFVGEISHDIAFGVVMPQPAQPLFPASWVDVSDGKKGLAYFHKGTPLHWVKDQMLENLVAWGEATDALDPSPPLQGVDQRLNGMHSIHSAIYPHPGDWRSADVIGAARNFNTPVRVEITDAHAGCLPDDISMLTILDREIACSAVRKEGEGLAYRMVSVRRAPVAVQVAKRGVEIEGLRALSGEEIEKVRPYQIVDLITKPSGKS
jgi:hypothetical protein